jgi:(p)ppGpp synthase/HD superfamily hydrolase
VAGILHDVIEDCVRNGFTSDALRTRIGDKFGEAVLTTVLAVTEARVGPDGIEFSYDERKADYLERLADASERARWVCAADKIHNASSVLADLKRTEFPENVWKRFRAGRDAPRWYRQVYERLAEVGFAAPIMDELRSVAEALEQAADIEPAERPPTWR